MPIFLKVVHSKLLEREHELGHFSIKLGPETFVQRCSVKKVFLEISQNLQESICAGVFLIKLQASATKKSVFL